ncbi:putative exopolygalacturonate lyase [Treponema primitia ZAS-2]|uniref:Putative exopolygalacturonate lyase n=1 Tax=Treponema primitia (strain ATCC BAA-887 / DSM 12427 / ZAS-2) TaxID=545694 RepID=F5YR71_TREPZ|nr:bacterial Ig-like domain-containing protein [Treponema primitia]AEF84975.1 putative exopolygalacturonate lyase [Treponema primitia ZAS-2]
MKQFYWLLISFAAVIVSGCSNPFFPKKPEIPPEPKAVLESLRISQEPNKSFYIIGEDFDHQGLEVIGLYSDNTEKIEPIDRENLSGYDEETPGPQDITVSVEEETATFTVIVCDLDHIAVSATPQKLNYAKGEALDITGLEIIGYYAYEDSPFLSQNEPVFPENLSGYNMEIPSPQSVTVTIKEKTAGFAIKVFPLEWLEITGKGKEYYVLGEELDLDSMEVTGHYVDPNDPYTEVTRIETLEPGMISGYDPDAMGSQTVTITIDGKTEVFTIKVWEFIDLVISSLPLKKIYTKGDELDLKGLVVIGTYTDDGSNTVEREETITLDNIIGYDKDLQDVQIITVKVRHLEVSFTITVEGQVQVLIYLDAPPGGVPEHITLSKTGVNFPSEVELTLSLEYEEYGWFINNSDSAASLSETFVLNAHGLPLSDNLLRIEVKTFEGIYYGKELVFTIVK